MTLIISSRFAVVELASELGDQLLELRDAVLEPVDIDGGAEAGSEPRLLAELFGEPILQLTDAARLACDLAVSVDEVGLKGCFPDCRPVSVARGITNPYQQSLFEAPT